MRPRVPPMGILRMKKMVMIILVMMMMIWMMMMGMMSSSSAWTALLEMLGWTHGTEMRWSCAAAAPLRPKFTAATLTAPGRGVQETPRRSSG